MPESNLVKLLKYMKPEWHDGEYVFTQVMNLENIPQDMIIWLFRESEGITLIVSREAADNYGLAYSWIFGWITLTVESSLEAIWLTAAFSAALGRENISCNIIAWYHHDHIFVQKSLQEKAIKTLNSLSEKL